MRLAVSAVARCLWPAASALLCCACIAIAKGGDPALTHCLSRPSPSISVFILILAVGLVRQAMPRGAGVVWALCGLRVRAGCAGERREGERATQTDGQSVSRGGEGDDADADARQGLSTGDAALLSPRLASRHGRIHHTATSKPSGPLTLTLLSAHPPRTDRRAVAQDPSIPLARVVLLAAR